MIDFLRDQLSDEEAEGVRRRLADEPKLCKLRDNLANTFAALDLCPSPEVPPDLTERTLVKIASIQRTNALITLQQTHRRSYRPTFALRELVAMIVIILSAACLIIPAMRMAYNRGQQSLCAAQLGQIGSSLQSYAVNHNGMLPTPEGSSSHWLDDNKPHTRNSSSLFKLLKGRYLSSPVLFQCPAVGGPSFAINPSMKDFQKAGHISYSYNYDLGGHHLSILDKNIARVATTLVILGDQTPLFAEGRFIPEKAKNPLSENHDRRGQNVLYIDGHVYWAIHANVGVDEDNIFLIQGIFNYTGDEEPASKTDTFLLPAYAGK